MKLINFDKLAATNQPIKKIITCYKSYNTIKATKKGGQSIYRDLHIYQG
jgi:hypothetical protein